MKVSKNSWHYRLYRYIGNIPRGGRYLNPFAKVRRTDTPLPKSLCPYAWSIFLGVVGVLVLAAVLCVIAPIFAVVWAMVWITVRVAAVGRRIDGRVWMFVKHRGKPHEKDEPKPRKQRRPSLVAAFFRARKDKVCPMIELVD